MEHADHIAATARELDALLEAAGTGAGLLDATVPTCPGWTVADLVDHVAWFVTRWSDRLRGTHQGDTPEPTTPDGDDAARVEWLRSLGDDLLTLLQATDADTHVWTWREPDQTAAFVSRRCAHELAVHRYDAQSARGTCAPIDAELAIDGIDEVLDVLSHAFYQAGEGAGETLHLHGTDDDLDVAAEWLVVLGADGLDVRREHAKGDLALRAAVSDLELLLVGRPPLGDIQRFGDESVLDDVWTRAFRF
jgi:uncharacterized protein (TIGR03083 family)